MRNRVAIVAGVVLVAAAAFGGGSIITSFKSPADYAVGLDYYSPYLYHADFNTTAEYIRVTTTAGSAVGTIPLPRNVQFHDLAYTGTHLWGLEYSPRVVYQLTTGGSLLSSFVPPANSRGITYDGGNLWVSEYHGNKMIWQLTTGGSVVKSFAGPSDWLAGLDWADGYMWVVVYCGDLSGLYRVTDNGSIVESIAPVPSGGLAMGVAWDGNYLWYTDYNKNYVYQVTTDLPVLPASVGKVKALFR